MVTYEIFVGALFSLLVVGAGAFYWLMSEIRGLRQDMRQEIRAVRQENREDNQALRKENREDNQALREEIQASTQRTLEALYFHRHDPDGAAVFYPPTPTTTKPARVKGLAMKTAPNLAKKGRSLY